MVTSGGEALYADMGHFGARPMRVTWWYFVFPALVLNYFGQGALILRNGTALGNPFYDLAPDWARYPMIFLAACATVIASQAVISGAFSLTRQAINLGQLPRMRVMQTSPGEAGQVYVPGINSIFLLGAVGLVIGFGSSGRLAGAYGVGVASNDGDYYRAVVFRGHRAMALVSCFGGDNLCAVPAGRPVVSGSECLQDSPWRMVPANNWTTRLPSDDYLEARTRASPSAPLERCAANRGFSWRPVAETRGSCTGYRGLF